MAALGLVALIVAGVAIVLLALVLVLLGEVAASFLPRRQLAPPEGRRRFAVLVPAHDEETLISGTVANILPELSVGDRLVVVADNCSDNTGMLAEKAGAEVLYRSDPVRRGKSYALDFGVRHLEAEPPEVVIIVDADCSVEAGALAAIAARAVQQKRPVQAHYLMELPSNGNPASHRIAAFAWRVKSFVRPTGLHRLGLPCQLMGTGMAFPWEILSTADLRTPEIVEDLVLGLQLARDGTAPLFDPGARVVSHFPDSLEGQTTQRTRWETGHLNVIAGRVPSLLWHSTRTANLHLFALAADAAVPPLAFLALAVVGLNVVAACLWVLGGAATLLALSLLTAVLLAVAVLLSWWKVGRDIISFTDLMCAPLYIFSKVALYGRVLIGRQVGWVRSKRS